jgi:hypothetical protein
MLDYVNILSTSTYLLIIFFVSNRVVDQKLARIFPHIDLSTNIFSIEHRFRVQTTIKIII